MEDDQIIKLYWDRNTTAINHTSEKYGSYCMTVARNVLQNEEDAEECVNDTWLVAWNSMPPKYPNCLSSYLARITRSKAIDRWRGQHREKRGGSILTLALEELTEVIPAKTSPEQAIIKQELGQAISQCLMKLPEEERNVFLARYWFLEPVSGIAHRFALTHRQVYYILHRTQNKLRRYLQEEEFI